MNEYKTFFPSPRKYVFTCLALFFTLLCLFTRSNMPKYGDVDVCYIPAGLAYISNASLDTVNWEHPPLAKYILGLWYSVFGDVFWVSLLFALITLLSFYLIALHVHGRFWSFILLLILSIDTLFMSVSSSGILDVFSLAFLMLFLLLWFKFRSRISYVPLAGLFAGLSLACKWSSSPVVIISLIAAPWVFRSSNWRRLLTRIFLALIFIVIAYTATYIPLILKENGFNKFILLQFKMLNYHSFRHGITFYRVFNGLCKVFLRFNIFKYMTMGHYVFYKTTVNGTVTLLTKHIGEVSFKGYKVYVFLGVPGLSSILFFPALAFNIWLLFKGRIKDVQNKLLILYALASTINLFPGPLDWYAYNILPFYYLLFPKYLSVLGVKKSYLIPLILNAISLCFLGFNIVAYEFIIKV